MGMENKGWIRIYRKEIDWFPNLTDRESVFYLAARCHAVWDKRSKLFGTFDARINEVHKEMLPHWSTGKVSEVRNLLINKGIFQKTNDFRRLGITNAELLFSTGDKFETYIQLSEDNLHHIDKKIQPPEKYQVDIFTKTARIVRNKRIFY